MNQMRLKKFPIKAITYVLGIYFLFLTTACEREVTVNHVNPVRGSYRPHSTPAYRQAPPPPYYYQAQPQPYPYYGQANAGSRFYSNPYAIPPSASTQYQYYDADQYYVPPTYQNNVESQYDGNGPF